MQRVEKLIAGSLNIKAAILKNIHLTDSMPGFVYRANDNVILRNNRNFLSNW